MMYDIIQTGQFKKDIKRIAKRGFDLQALKKVISMLQNGEVLPPVNHDHALSGEYSGFRECHVEPDFLFIYTIIESQLVLVCSRTGTHSDLF